MHRISSVLLLALTACMARDTLAPGNRHAAHGGTSESVPKLIAAPFGLVTSSGVAMVDGLPAIQLVELRNNDNLLYPRNEDMEINSMTSSPTGVVFSLTSPLPKFASFIYSVDDQGERIASDGRIAVDIQDLHALDPQTSVLTVWAVDQLGIRSTPRQVEFTYFSAEEYAQSGRTARSAVTIDFTDIPQANGHVRDWIVDQPTEDDVAFAQKVWGATVAAESTPVDRARALAEAIIDALDPYRGIPSDWMQDAAPFDQYRRVVAGQDHVWCDNFAKIFVRAAICLGIPARMVELPGRKANDAANLDVLWADGHTTTEIFDEMQNRWVWTDLTLSILGATMTGDAPLTVATLHRYLADPTPRAAIVLEQYDPKTHASTDVAVSHDDVRRSMMQFFNAEQRYLYYFRPSL
jgi:hypothetical protein